MILRPFGPDDEAAALVARAELAADHFEFLLEYRPDMSWAEFLDRLDRTGRGVDIPPDRVPSSLLAADVDGKLVGRVSIRHELNPFLAEVGGHIGYGVRPGFRRRGYATQILEGALREARHHGIDHALVTCEDTNIGSAKAIEACGGVFERMARDNAAVPKRRYWIDLSG